MGTHIYFRHRVRPEDVAGSFLLDEEEDEDLLTEHLGSAYFSGFTAKWQHNAYGIDYTDCLTYGPEHPEDIGQELVGDPDIPGTVEGWFTPDWDRAVRRVERLLAAWQATTNEHRKEYDAKCLPPFAELIRQCAAHPDREGCQVIYR